MHRHGGYKTWKYRNHFYINKWHPSCTEINGTRSSNGQKEILIPRTHKSFVHWHCWKIEWELLVVIAIKLEQITLRSMKFASKMIGEMSLSFHEFHFFSYSWHIIKSSCSLDVRFLCARHGKTFPSKFYKSDKLWVGRGGLHWDLIRWCEKYSLVG